jgi:ATP-dependent Zn protease
MTNEKTGMMALTIPALPAGSDLVEVRISTAALDHMKAWDASSRLEAIHESGHACAAAAVGIKVKAVDITSRMGGHTQTGSPMDDGTIPWETSGRMLDRMVVALAGSAAERVILGEHTTGGEADNDHAVLLASRWIKSGFGGPGLFIGEDGLGFASLTDEIKTRTLLRIMEVVADCQARADALMAEHRDALLVVATAVYEQRRITDERLDAVLRSAGFTLPGTTE